MEKQKEAEKIIRNHIYGAMGVGLIPVPLVDVVALTGVHLNMLRKLAKLYNIPFSKDTGKNLIASLLGGTIPVSVSGTLASMVKAIPIIGQTTGALTMPATSGAMTYAVGRVFLQHFESGGTFLNFNPEKVREHYARLFEEGKKVVAEVKKEDAKPVVNGESTETIRSDEEDRVNDNNNM
jgi:uncharacterized protein (DUF697 family)